MAPAPPPPPRYHRRMSLRREPPPTPRPESPSVLLMRTLGDLQLMEGGEPITDIETLALMCGIVWQEIPALIEVGITAGFLEAEEFGAGIGLSAKGQRWHERDLLRRE